MDDTKKKKIATNGNRRQNLTKADILSNLKKISSTIGKMELQRESGIFVPISQVITKKREFLKYMRLYKKYSEL